MHAIDAHTVTIITPNEARVVICDWIDHYNHDRRHTGLGNRTPAQVRYPGSGDVPDALDLPADGAVATTSSTTTENSHKGGPTWGGRSRADGGLVINEEAF